MKIMIPHKIVFAKEKIAYIVLLIGYNEDIQNVVANIKFELQRKELL